MYTTEDAMKRIVVNRTVVNRIVVAAALLLGTSLAAQAYPVTMYHDLIRPNGHPRSEAIYQSNLDACYRQTGQSRYAADGPAFKNCMASHGYRFAWQRYAPNPRRYGGSPGVDDWTPPPESPPTGPTVNEPGTSDYLNANPPPPEVYEPSPSPDCPGSLC